MRDDFYGAPPHALTMGEGIYARLLLALRPCGNYICGVSPRRENDFAGLGAPHPDMRGKVFMGLRPMPHLGSFFGKKLPKNPKKPNCIGFRL